MKTSYESRGKIRTLCIIANAAEADGVLALYRALSTFQSRRQGSSKVCSTQLYKQTTASNYRVARKMAIIGLLVKQAVGGQSTASRFQVSIISFNAVCSVAPAARSAITYCKVAPTSSQRVASLDRPLAVNSEVVVSPPPASRTNASNAA